MPEVVVVGAGVAGLAAAAALRSAGRDVALIEAADRIGGRAWTARPTALGGAPFDHGASWLHDAERNPLADLARHWAEPLIDSDARRNRLLFVGGRRATEQESAAYDSCWAGVGDVVPTEDTTLAAVLDRLAADPWLATVETWEGPIIAAADAGLLSAHDWHRNELNGANLRIEGGLGAFVARRLATPARLNCRVTAIDVAGPGVRVETSDGTLRADFCIVTVSTGVLPMLGLALPPEVQDALHGLPMGLLSKVAVRAKGTGRLGVADNTSIVRQVEARGAPAMSLYAWPDGADHVIGFMGGRTAWDRLDPRDAAAFLHEQLARLFGDVRDQFEPGGVATGWGDDPLTLGAYAYARPGHAHSRAVLAQTCIAGRLWLAGEAYRSDGLAGTVAGAWLSGKEAAARVLACCRS